ncbi:MAG: hypothetical protein JJW01_00145 [Alphaproteobacteria bacterium]|nr:hypothetical protein [Rickettsiales bacterium]
MNKVKIIKPERFGGEKQTKYLSNASCYSNASMNCHNIVTTKEKQQGYFPRTAIMTNAFMINDSFTNLSTECSLPKILFDNNVEELRDSDFEDIVKKLREKLLILGYDVSGEDIKDSYVQKVDFSKNFIIKNNPRFFIDSLKKIAIDSRLGATETDYQRCGTGMKFYTKLYHITVYDKILEVEKSLKYSDNRSLTQDNYSQKEVINLLKKNNLSMIRYEISLKRRKIKKLPIEEKTLRNVFSSELSKQVLTKYIEKMHTGIRGVSFDDKNSFLLNETIKSAFPNIKSNKLSSLKGYMSDIAKYGYDFLKTEYEMSSSQICRLRNDIKAINKIEKSTNPILNDIDLTESSLERFKALRLKK